MNGNGRAESAIPDVSLRCLLLFWDLWVGDWSQIDSTE
jgi:hypothetical protein